VSTPETRGGQQSPGASSSPGLLKDAIGLGGSIILGMAGSAPAAVIAITLVPLLLATAYGIVPSLLIAMVAMLCIAVAFQRLNLWEQNAGGPYKWAARAIHPIAGFAVGWFLIAAFLLASIANVTTLGPAVLGLLGMNTSSQTGAAIAAVVIGGLLVGSAVLGIRLTARLQVSLAIAEYAILIAFAVFALFAIFVTHPSGSFTPDRAFLSFSGTGAGTLAAGLLVAVFFFAEWDAGIYENEETKRPARNPGLAAIIAVAILGVIYTFVSVAFAGVAPPSQMSAHAANAAVFVADRLAGGAAGRVMALAVVSSVLAATQATFVAFARILMSMSRDRVMPGVFSRISPRYHTPAAATLILGGVAIILTLVYVFSSSVAGALSDLIATDGLMFALYYAAAGLTAAWVYRRQLTSSVSGALLGGLAPIAGSALLIWVAVKAIQGFTITERWVLAGIVAAGVAMLLVARFVYKAPSLTGAEDPDLANVTERA
jgi:amino acid transporter